MDPGAKRIISLTPEEQKRRKYFLGATLISCIALAMVFGTVHVVQLGSNRMADMRSKAGYDLKDEHKHIRAAGEDIELHKKHETSQRASVTYSSAEVNALLSPEKWQEIESLIKIPAGNFQMGTDHERADAYNKPLHTVWLGEYYIDKYPVTNAQFAKFIVETKYRPPLDWNQGKIPDDKVLHPVTMVTWYDAKNYCAHVGKRLPTEQEWEKAARGNQAYRWPWGDNMDPKNLNTYYYVGATTVVDKYAHALSPFGVFDMAGNVSEWTASDFNPYAGSKAASSLFVPKAVVAQSPQDRALKVADLVPMEKGVYKVRRGGSWKSDPFTTASYHRNFSMPYYASDFFGFRCAKSNTKSNTKSNKS